METELQNVNGTLNQTATSAEGAGTALDSIGKKVSFDAVISGIGKITDKMAAAANMAKNMATAIVSAVQDSASWADDLATTATVYGMTPDEVQRMRYTADILDTSFDTIVSGRRRLVNAMQSDSDVFAELGVQIREVGMAGREGYVEGDLRNWEDVFWDLGAALTNIEQTKGFEYVNKQAQQLLGKNWEQLKPIFNSDWASEDNYLGRAFDSAREYYEAVMASWNTVNDEDINKLTKYDDALHKLQNEITTLQETTLAQLAPGLTEVTNMVSGLVSEFNQYLQTDEGKEKLDALSEAVTELFRSLTDVDFGTVLDSAKGALDSLTKGLKWIKDNGETVKGVLEGLAIAFGALKISEGVLTFMQLLASGKYLFSNGQITGYNGGGDTGGGWTSGIKGALSTAAEKVSGVLSNPQIQTSVPAVMDWFMHNTPMGHWFMGTETPEQTLKEIQQNADTFDQDWRENKLTGWAVELGENSIKFWDQFWKGAGETIDNFFSGTGNDEGWDEYEEELARRVQEDLGETPVELLPELPDDVKQQIKDQTKGATVEVSPDVIGDAAAEIAAQVGTVSVPVSLVWDRTIGGAGGGVAWNSWQKHANGLFSVPWDGYPAILHKGEQVVPAREVQSRSYNSNLYVENMIMNNGTDASGLASAMAAAQRREMAGYGS